MIRLLFACTGSQSTPAEPETAPVQAVPQLADIGDFNHLSQGSETISWLMFSNMERADSQQLFRDDLERFGLIPNPEHTLGLPIGMSVTRDSDGDPERVGQTCAACHVGRIEYEGQGWTLDGVPNMFESTRFFREASRALKANLEDRDKLERLLSRILSSELSFGGDDGVYSPAEQAFVDLAAELITEERQRIEGLVGQQGRDRARELLLSDRRPKPDEGLVERLRRHPLATIDAEVNGFLFALTEDQARTSRLAATYADLQHEARMAYATLRFTQAYASSEGMAYTEEGPGRVDAFGRVRAQILPLVIDRVMRPLTAPVSIPHLFDIDKVKWLHWNGNTDSVLERNIIEAVGSGAIVDFRRYDSDVDIENLFVLEQATYAFSPPPWPFGSIDADKAALGKTLFGQHCAQCHQDRPTGPEPVTYPTFSLSEIGTDPNHVNNFAADVDGTPLPTILTDLGTRIKRRYFEDREIDAPRQRELETDRAGGVFRDPGPEPLQARPLTAVWATAPYLHNGSVPTLYHLLLPTDQRPRTFPLGHREYDPELVGYTLDAEDAPFTFDVDAPVLVPGGGKVAGEANGNSNGGHLYGTTLAAADRMALVEYLKTL